METSLLDPRIESVIVPAIEQTPLPHLRIYDGFGCSCCPLVSQAVHVMRKYYNITHALERRSRGGRKCSVSRAISEQLESAHFGEKPPWKAVKFQRFFRSGPGSSGFRIDLPERQASNVGSRPDKRGPQSAAIANKVWKTLATLVKNKHKGSRCSGMLKRRHRSLHG